MQDRLDKINEESLWRKMKKGDHNSFSQIFKFYYPQLYVYGVKLVPFPDFIRDQIQELFIYIWQNRSGLGDVSNLKAYLLVSLRRRIFASKKDNQGTDSLNDISEEENQTLFFEPGEFVDKNFISASLREKLLNNLNSLPVNQREIIFLRFYHQLTYREIADIINIKEQSIKNNMPHILQKLAEGLTDFSKEDIKDVDIMLFNFFLLFQKK